MVDNLLPDQPSPSPLVLGFRDLGTWGLGNGLANRPGKQIRTLDLILLCNTQLRGTWGIVTRAYRAIVKYLKINNKSTKSF